MISGRYGPVAALMKNVYTHHNSWSDIVANKLLGDGADEISGRLAEQSGLRLLDVGCGNGATLKGLKSRFPTAQLFGLDREPLPVEVAGTTDFDFFLGNIEDLGDVLAKKTYDFILSINCFMYVVKQREALIAMALALNPGGKAYIVMEPAYMGPHAFKMFEGPMSRFFRWHTDRDGKTRTIIIEHGLTKDKAAEFMADFVRYPYPYLLLSQGFLDKDPSPTQKPHFFPTAYRENEIEEGFARLDGKYSDPRPVPGLTMRNWGLFPFLKFTGLAFFASKNVPRLR